MTQQAWPSKPLIIESTIALGSRLSHLSKAEGIAHRTSDVGEASGSGPIAAGGPNHQPNQPASRPPSTIMA